MVEVMVVADEIMIVSVMIIDDWTMVLFDKLMIIGFVR